jgi:predicted nucleotidyltransferase
MLYPDAERLPHLANELSSFFARMPSVVRVMVFGSLARGEADRWSDLDLIVVTSSRAHFQPVFARLPQFKPIMHHTPFTLHTDSDAAYVLGIVFTGESVFHCLDLNFLTAAQAQMPGALQRFGVLQTLYTREAEGTVIYEPVPPRPAEDPVEKRINEAMHFTKKALKKLLRGKGTREELRPFADHLKSVLDDYPEGIIVPGGSIGLLAHSILDLAEVALATISPPNPPA